MSRYLYRQRQVVADYEALLGAEMPDLLREIIMKRPSHLPLSVQLRGDSERPGKGESIDAKDVAESFAADCYNLMSSDQGRIRCYERLVDATPIDRPNLQWLEVGPGSDACLAKMVLARRHTATYVGVEVNRAAFKAAKRLLAPHPNASVIQGFIDERFTKFPVHLSSRGIPHQQELAGNSILKQCKPL